MRRSLAAGLLLGEPAWSPDGGRIVWSELRPGTPELFTMTAPGGPATPLTTPAGGPNSEAADR